MDTITVAVIALFGTVVSAYFSYKASAKQHDKTTALIEYRLNQLEQKVDKHNHLVERTYKIEEGLTLNSEKIKVANHRIDDLENQQNK